MVLIDPRFQNFWFCKIGGWDSIFVFLRTFSSQPPTKLYHKLFVHLGVFHTIYQKCFYIYINDLCHSWLHWDYSLIFPERELQKPEGFQVWVLTFKNIDLPCHGSVPNQCKTMWSSYYDLCISSRWPTSYNGCQTSVANMSHSITLHHWDQKCYLIHQFCKIKKCKTWDLLKPNLKNYSKLQIFY